MYGRNSENIEEKLKFIETNNVHCIDIPMSLVDFCEEQGFEAPDECEHVHYVNMY